MCELLVGLDHVDVLDVEVEGLDVTIAIETRQILVGCPSCGVLARSKGRRSVRLADVNHGFRRVNVLWIKRRWCCPDADCPRGSWTEEDRRIAHPRSLMLDRAARWVTEQVGRYARSVSEVAETLGCSWHTVNDAVLLYGEALIDLPGRFGEVSALGLDEVLFLREGTYRTQRYSTQIVDVNRGQLLDVVPGRKGAEPKAWLEAQGADWLAGIDYATLDLSGSYRAVFDAVLPNATQVADPFHVVKLANEKLDETRRRVQNETLGHRGRKGDPLFRCRRLLTRANERLSEGGKDKLLGLLAAGDPRGDVATAWTAKEAVRELYAHIDPALALEWVDALSDDMDNEEQPIEVRSLGRTLKRWRLQIAAWHEAQVSNGPTEAVNNLIKRVKRGAFGFRRFKNYRIRALLYAGKPDWSLLGMVGPP